MELVLVRTIRPSGVTLRCKSRTFAVCVCLFIKPVNERFALFAFFLKPSVYHAYSKAGNSALKRHFGFLCKCLSNTYLHRAFPFFLLYSVDQGQTNMNDLNSMINNMTEFMMTPDTALKHILCLSGVNIKKKKQILDSDKFRFLHHYSEKRISSKVSFLF